MVDIYTSTLCNRYRVFYILTEMHKRLKKLYPNSSEEYIQKAVEHIKESEVLTGHSHKLEEITDEEIKMYYEQIINGIL